MMPKVRALLKSANLWLALISLLAGCLAYVLARQHLERREQQVTSTLTQRYQLEGRIVAARALAAGEVISPESLAIRQLPVQFARADSLLAGQAAGLLGGRVRHAMRAGDMLVPADVEVGRAAGLSLALASGQRALTIEVDPVNGMDGQLRPGDRVDLYHVHSTRVGETTLSLLLQAARVLATGQQTLDAPAGNDGVGFSTVTLLLSPDDAARLLLAQRTGQVFTALRHPDDSDEVQLRVRDARHLSVADGATQRRARPPVDLQVISGGGKTATVQQSTLKPLAP
jgi:pilus assembly protein CpaB